MSPDRDFYLSNENFADWKNTYASDILERAGFGCKITADDKSLIAFSIPDGEHLGYGTLVIPLRVPDRIGRKRINHPLSQEALTNTLFFNGTNSFDQILQEFGVDRKKGRSLSEFHFSSYGTIEGEWYLLIDRLPPKSVAQWRDHKDSADFPKSAVGLATSFVRKFEGWSLEPILKPNPR